jgi:hypothetical protein
MAGNHDCFELAFWTLMSKKRWSRRWRRSQIEQFPVRTFDNGMSQKTILANVAIVEDKPASHRLVPGIFNSVSVRITVAVARRRFPIDRFAWFAGH